MAGSVTGIKAGKAFILIEAVDATGKILNTIRSRLGKFGTELSNIGRTMALRAIGALTPAAFAVKSGTAYDDIMRKVEARSEGTAAEMALLKDQTLKLGRAFGILPSRLGGIQNIFAQAGFSRKDIASIGPAVALLSRAGGEGADAFMDTENAAKAVSAVLRGFDMDATKSSEVVDKLAVALNASNFNLEDITTSLQYAVPAAKFYNVSLNETLAILGAMRDLQIDASIAGTAFRNMMMYMSQTSEQEKFNEELTKMTGNTVEFKDALGNLHSPLKLLPAMLKATEGMGTAERSNLFSGILQARATIPGAAIGRSVGRMSEMLTLLDKHKGAAQKVQKQMDSGLGGAFRRIAASIETAAIKFQNALAPALHTVTEAIDKLIASFTAWIVINPGLVTGIIASVVGFLALGTALVVAGQAVIALSALFGLGATLASLTAYLLAFVAPWALAAAGIYAAALAIEDFLGASGTVDATLGKIGPAAASAFSSVTTEAKAATEHLRKDWTETLTSIANRLKSGDIEGAFKTLTLQLNVTWAECINSLMNKWEEFQQFMADTKSQSGSIFEPIAKALNWFYTTTEGPDTEASRVTAEYIKSLHATNEGMYAESQNTPEAQARKAAKEKREAALAELRKDLTTIRSASPAANPIPDTPDTVATPAKIVEEKKKAMEEAAAALIGPGKIMPGTPKSSNDAIERTSSEAMKAFQEAKNNVYGTDALKVAEESRDHLAEIRRRLEEGGAVGV